MRETGGRHGVKTPAVTKVTLNLPQDVLAAVEEMASHRGLSQTQVVIRAVSTEKFMFDLLQDGSKIFVEHRDGRSTELKFP